MTTTSSTKQRVSYFYQPDVGHFYYGPSHPMKPHRITMAHHLILSYGLYRKMECYRSHPASAAEMTAFHSEEYINFLSKITPDNVRLYANQMQRFNVGEYTDCPVFDGQYEFFQLSSGASIDGAVKLNGGDCDIAINWSGGLHHAKKSEASGFCYVNDIVLAILELLKVHARVLYIDIDVHHGDGVEEAFYCTDRVMTFSLHKYGDFFPGTGHIKDTGAREGTGFSVNAPLTSGITDDAYERLFKPVLDRIMDVYRPGAIVLQCGADSLTGDRLGCFNLSLRGHGECVRYTQSFGVPTLVLGGGGYTIRNVARCWAYETSVLLDTDLPNEIPYNDYFEYYAPDFKLHLTPENRENMNTEASLESVRTDLLTQLMNLRGAPSVQMAEIPPDFEIMKDEAANSEGIERKSTKEDDNQRKGGGDDEEEGMNDGGINDDRRTDRSMTKDGRGQKREHDAELEG